MLLLFVQNLAKASYFLVYQIVTFYIGWAVFDKYILVYVQYRCGLFHSYISTHTYRRKHSSIKYDNA